MSQVPSWQVPAHPSGLDMRTQLNAIVLALVGDNTGPNPPTPTYPGMWWNDTTSGQLKRVNSTNSAWIVVGPIDDFLSGIRATAANAVQKTGDTMTGGLLISGTGVVSSPLWMKAGSYQPHFRSNSSVPGFEWVNGANSAVPMWLTDTGQLNVTTSVSVGQTGSVYWPHSKGRMWIRGDGGIGNYGGMGIINNAGNSWRFMITDEGLWSFGNYAYTAVNVTNSSTAPDPNGYQGTLGPGFIKINEFNYGPYIDFSRARDQDYSWRMHLNFNNNTMEFQCKGGGNTIISSDGNIYVPAISDWISNVNARVNGKAGAGARVQWDSGIAEWGPINGPTTLDIGAPWVMEGWRTASNGNWVSGAQWLRGVCLRNQ